MKTIRLRVGKSVVAMAQLGTDYETGNVIVERVYVKPKYRGRGYAKRLMKLVVAFADQRRMQLQLDARPGEYQGQKVARRDVRRLQRLYKAVGFKKVRKTTMIRKAR